MNREELFLSQIWIYPVKSLGGIALQSSRVLPKGLEFDRRWMLVNENGSALTQREFPLMALFKVQLTDTTLNISYENDSLIIPICPESFVGERQADVWEEQITALEISYEYNRWFSEKLNVNCRLLYFPENNSRPVDTNFQIHQENVSLADAFPILIIGEQSLSDLNSRLQEPVPMNRFRPNLVFNGGEPFAEDIWNKFTIGSNHFAAVKPCARCMVPTVNQNSGIKGIEPIKTLAKYRTINHKVYFGQNVLALTTPEVIKVGDRILVETFKSEFIPAQPV